MGRKSESLIKVNKHLKSGLGINLMGMLNEQGLCISNKWKHSINLWLIADDRE